MRPLQIMENPRHYGPITCLCIDRKRSWIVVGTSTGVLTLWDRRFGLLLKSWHVGVASSGRSVRIHQCVVHPSKGKGKWVMVSMESSRRVADRSSTTNLIEVWDIETGTLIETFITRTASTSLSSTEPIPEPREVVGEEADSSPAGAIAALVRSRQSGSEFPDRWSSRTISGDNLLPSPAPDIRAFVVGLEFGGHSTAHRTDLSGQVAGRGFIISGSEDRKIRLWDLGKLERTCVLSGLEMENEKPSYQLVISLSTKDFVLKIASHLQDINDWNSINLHRNMANTFE